MPPSENLQRGLRLMLELHISMWREEGDEKGDAIRDQLDEVWVKFDSQEQARLSEFSVICNSVGGEIPFPYSPIVVACERAGADLGVVTATLDGDMFESDHIQTVFGAVQEQMKLMDYPEDWARGKKTSKESS